MRGAVLGMALNMIRKRRMRHTMGIAVSSRFHAAGSSIESNLLMGKERTSGKMVLKWLIFRVLLTL
jgi:hypothetical protein